MTLHHCVILALIAPAMAMTHETTSATSPNAPTRDECPGQWVKVRDTHEYVYSTDTTTAPAATAPVVLSDQRFANQVESSEKSRYGLAIDQAQVNAILKVHRDGRGTEASRRLTAGRQDFIQYEWQPVHCPIVNRDVLVDFGGSVSLSFNTSTTDDEVNDFASATAAISLTATGNVGNEIIATVKGDGVSSSFVESLGGWSRIKGIKERSNAGFSFNGSIEYTNDPRPDPAARYEGSLGAAAGYVGSSSLDIIGAAQTGGEWKVEVSHSKIKNTNNVKIYFARLNQQVTCTGVADCSFGDDSHANAQAISTVRMHSPQ